MVEVREFYPVLSHHNNMVTLHGMEMHNTGENKLRPGIRVVG